MTQPVSVNVDLAVRATYVECAPGPSVQTIDLTETGGVAYDLNAEGNIVGIEVLGIQSPERVEISCGFAEPHGLAFPRDIIDVLVAT